MRYGFDSQFRVLLGFLLLAAACGDPDDDAISDRAIDLIADHVTTVAGNSVSFAVRFDARGEVVAGTQNELEVEGPLVLDSCESSPESEKLAQVAYGPAGCLDTENCREAFVLVISFENVDPIPDGVPLYRCTVLVPSGTATGTYEIKIRDAVAADPMGRTVKARTFDGSITIE